MINYKSNNEILELLNKRVKGHINAKKALINLVNRSMIRYHQAYRLGLHDDELIEPSKCLLIGQSGTGKTFMLNCLKDILDFPLVKLDASDFNPVGASGGIKSDEVFRKVSMNAADLSQKQGQYTGNRIQSIVDRTIVFVDEVDKMSKHYGTNDGSWAQHTQTNFLNIFESCEPEYAGVSFVFAGAFSSIESYQDSAYPRAAGFTSNLQNDGEAKREITDQDIIEYGFIPELVGRLGNIVSLDELTEDDYRSILLDSLLPKKLEDLIYYNCADFVLTGDQVDEIVATAMESGQGVRSLKRELDKLIIDIEFNYEEVGNHSLLLPNLLEKFEDE